jgi:AcrR family transcriptional regulator
MAATVELLGQGTFEGLSIDAVTDRAGVSKATVYRWWRNKTELVAEAMGRFADDSTPDPDTGSFQGDVDVVLGALLATASSPGGRMVEAVAAAAQDHPDLLAALEEHFLPDRRRLVRRILERAAARGELKPATDPALVADVVVTALFFRVRLKPAARDVAFVESLVHLVVDGVRA